MDKNQKYLEQQNRDLKFLLEFEMIERRQIAGDFHGKAAALTSAKLYLGLLIKKSEELRDTANIIDRLVDEAIDNFRNVSRKIHPKDTERHGLLVGINDYIKRNTEARNDLIIINNSPSNAKLNIKFQNEIGLYKTCTFCLEFLINLGYCEIYTELKIEGQYLFFCAEGRNYKPLPVDLRYDFTISNELLLRAMQAMINLQDAEVFSETNWENVFKIGFDLTKHI